MKKGNCKCALSASGDSVPILFFQKRSRASNITSIGLHDSFMRKPDIKLRAGLSLPDTHGMRYGKLGKKKKKMKKRLTKGKYIIKWYDQ